MRKFVFLLAALLSFSAASQAQTFLEHLRAKEEGKGTVTITQSKQIDELVNARKAETPQTAGSPKNNTLKVETPQTVTKKKEEKRPATPVRKEVSATENHSTVAPQHHEESAKRPQKQEPDSTRKEAQKKEAEAERIEEARKRAEQQDNTDFDIPTVDMRKKVMRGAYKVNGYRVQVFSGGNSRADKQKAQQIGNNVKMAFPNQPVYVHFYSPSWKCRVGNFRTYGEAEHMMKELKKMGYRQACVLRGKITVQD